MLEGVMVYGPDYDGIPPVLVDERIRREIDRLEAESGESQQAHPEPL
jgi:hypothetical protein